MEDTTNYIFDEKLVSNIFIDESIKVPEGYIWGECKDFGENTTTYTCFNNSAPIERIENSHDKYFGYNIRRAIKTLFNK